ncbi:predicted protein [Histoplasma capsulatum H143]|uniref:Uncharacterized protein n=1 Tax=Ajellomyces capsulatus (strain H143) TaxID=544712 RepID=C6H790_AJECH|nr:predicted protein [Histoplasma capsulatum H143]
MFDARRRTRFSVEGVVENRPVHPRLIEGAKNVEIGPWCLMTTWLAQNREDTVHCTYVIARIDCVELGARGIISQRVTALLMDFVNDDDDIFKRRASIRFGIVAKFSEDNSYLRHPDTAERRDLPFPPKPAQLGLSFNSNGLFCSMKWTHEACAADCIYAPARAYQDTEY